MVANRPEADYQKGGGGRLSHSVIVSTERTFSQRRRAPT